MGHRYKIWLTQNLKDRHSGVSPQGVQSNDDVQGYTATDLNRSAMHFKSQKKGYSLKNCLLLNLLSETQISSYEGRNKRNKC